MLWEANFKNFILAIFRFFDKPNKVARSWMEKDSVMKLSDAESPPKNPPLFKSEAVKKRYSHAKSMALDAISLPKIERLIESFNFDVLNGCCK